MHVYVNWSDVCLSLILLAAGVLAAAVYCFLESRRIAAEEKRTRRAFEREMATVELPEWNGDTYDWTPESLAYLADTYVPGDAAATAEMPVPPSEMSGPMHVMDGTADTDEFIERLRAENTAFLAQFDIPAEVP